MHLVYRNVNEAFANLVKDIHSGDIETVRKDSRNGPVLMVEEPVTITYMKPIERVLFNRARDANPFFHLYESLWMLGGHRDLASLKYFVSTFDQFSDDGIILNGAYGYRWINGACSYCNGEGGIGYDEDGCANEDKCLVCHGEGVIDQLKILAEHLIKKPESRRAVLQMWNVKDDLMKIDTSKDVCCNLSACFSIRTQELSNPYNRTFKSDGLGGVTETTTFHTTTRKYLDMTVFNRSNDMIWGTLGANAVHFSFLQEYMASALNAEVGKYSQISNNMHVYEKNFKPEEWLADETTDLYALGVVNNLPLVEDLWQFQGELAAFTATCPKKAPLKELFEEKFFVKVAFPMIESFRLHKEKDYCSALSKAEEIEAVDWKFAAINWLKKRQMNSVSKRNPYVERELPRQTSGTDEA